MSTFPISASYASAAEFQRYLTGTGYAQGAAYGGSWGQDTGLLMRTLETCSRRMEQTVHRIWQPRLLTREYDIARRHHDPHLPEYDWAGYGNGGGTPHPYWPQMHRSQRRLGLGDWLLSATSVTAYADTARSASITLTEGITGDFLLLPYDERPARWLVLLETTTNLLSAGQQTVVLSGLWGWQNVTQAITTLTAPLTSGATSATFTDNVVSLGQTLVIDAEQIYVPAPFATPTAPVTATTQGIQRGVNGTTAASHSAAASVSVYQHPSDVVDACLALARLRLKYQDAGELEPNPDHTPTRKAQKGQRQSDEETILCRLDWYGTKRERSGATF